MSQSVGVGIGEGKETLDGKGFRAGRGDWMREGRGVLTLKALVTAIDALGHFETG